MKKRDWLKKSSVAVLLSSSLMMFGEAGQVLAAQADASSVASFATDLVGKPYRANADGPTSFDSAGYVSYVLSHFGVQAESDLAKLFGGGEPIAADALQAGDVVFFRSETSPINFAGVYVGGGKFLYASQSKGQVVERNLSELWGKYIGARRYPLVQAETPAPTPQPVPIPTPTPDPTPTTPPTEQPAPDGGSEIEPSAIANAARALIGKDYTSGGNGPDGFDAAGLISYVYSEADISLPDSIKQLNTTGTAVDRNQMHQGDILFFKSQYGNPSYAGIYVGDNRFVYAYQGGDEVVERSLTGSYSTNLVGVRRILGTVPVTPGGPVVDEPVDPTPTPAPVETGDNAAQIALAKKIIATGEEFKGIPYKFGAEYETSGRFDCSSFTQYIFKQNGIKIPRTARPQSKIGTPVAREDLQIGDLVFFSTKATMKYAADSVNRVGHVGVYAGDNKVLHTYGEGGVRYSTLAKGWWDDHYVRAVRVIQ
ncbi:C40 family peptidase [Brevibacillus dissolubilis]|uniref:C40 family peptidase n=1 Tax=Brevibacillus dissolubilis TaxID=1844116 RepID=UPI001116AB87|nr:C40 family peptidase [Brevibacillus dissolubilis]